MLATDNVTQFAAVFSRMNDLLRGNGKDVKYDTKYLIITYYFSNNFVLSYLWLSQKRVTKNLKHKQAIKQQKTRKRKNSKSY